MRRRAAQELRADQEHRTASSADVNEVAGSRLRELLADIRADAAVPDLATELVEALAGKLARFGDRSLRSTRSSCDSTGLTR